jgi:hypothetical protein
MNKEEWKPIPQYPGFEASSQGRIRRPNGKIPKQSTTELGYLVIGIKRTPTKVHRLVAMAFIPNPNGFKTINHKDGCKTNNQPNNLEWCTHQQNMMHAYKTGLIKLPPDYAKARQNTA